MKGATRPHAAQPTGLAWRPLRTFAIMALLAGVLGAGPPDMLCSAAQDAPLLSGMALMYLLMSAFHAAPWLNLIAGNRASPIGVDAYLPHSGQQ